MSLEYQGVRGYPSATDNKHLKHEVNKKPPPKRQRNVSDNGYLHIKDSSQEIWQFEVTRYMGSR